MKFATLVIDLQQGLAQGAYQIEQVLANTNKVIAHTREQGGLVIFIQHCHSTFTPLMKGRPGWQIHPQLHKLEPDIVIEQAASY